MKIIRFNIARPVDLSWHEFSNTFRDIQHTTAKALNFCMTAWYLWQKEKEGIKEVNGKYPSFKEFPEPTKRLYAELRGRYPELSARMVSVLIQKSRLKWRSESKEVFFRHTKSLSTYKKTHPVILDRQSLKLEKTEGAGYSIAASLKSRVAEKGKRRVSFYLNTKRAKASQKIILNNIISGEYRSGGATVNWNERKKQWHINILYEPPKKEIELDPNRIVGLNFGINNAFFCAVSDGQSRLQADGGEINTFRKRIGKRKVSIQRQVKFSGRKGKGRNKIIDPVLKLAEKERRFRDGRYHHFSKAIVEFAVAQKAGTIQLGSLNSLKAENQKKAILLDWAPADLLTKLKYKAEEYGIKIVEVAPRRADQRCSSCGHIDEANINGVKFHCKQCEKRSDADYNTAKNLSTEGIDNIIDNELNNLDKESET